MLLILLAAISTPLAIMANWVTYQVLEADAYVGAVQPIVRRERVQRDLVDLIMRELDPALASVTASQTPIRLLVRGAGGHEAVLGQIRGLLASAVATGTFEEIWGEVNRSAHAMVDDVLRGDGAVTDGENGRVFTLNLAELVASIEASPTSPLGQMLAAIPPDQMPQIALFEVPEMPEVAFYVRHARLIGVLLAALSILLIGAGIWLAPSRRRAIAWAGAAMIVSLGIALLVRSRLVDTFARVSDPQERYLATTYVDALVTPLEIALLVAAVIGLATAVAAWLLGRRGRRTAVPARS
jgi:multisubunit Na+/H+ antiporter MnhC subunit